MAKKKKSSVGIILVFLGLIIGLSALICLAGTGLTSQISKEFMGVKLSATVNYGLVGFLTGKLEPELIVAADKESAGLKAPSYEGYISTFAIIALILTILGSLISLAGAVLGKKSKIIIVIGGFMLILAGIFMFMLPIAGTNPENGAKFAEIFNNKDLGFKLGIGTILYGILSILGGLLVTAGAVIKKN